jgi:hypothetical protein
LLERILWLSFVLDSCVTCHRTVIHTMPWLGCQIVSAATMYTDVEIGIKYILVINKALHMPNLPYC